MASEIRLLAERSRAARYASASSGCVTALGAGRRRLVAQMLTESLLLAAAGGLFGLAPALAFHSLGPDRGEA